jgi:excisionase family DNA binding protein
VEKNSTGNKGYAKVKEAANYAGVSERSFRDWLKNGLRHSRLNTGTILIPYAAIDEYLARFEVSRNHVDDIVDEVMQEL